MKKKFSRKVWSITERHKQQEGKKQEVMKEETH